MAKTETTLQDAKDITSLKKCDIIITCQGGDYTTDEIFPQLRAAGLEWLLDRCGIHPAHGRRCSDCA